MPLLRNSARILGGAFVLSLALSAQTFTTLYNFGAQEYGAYFPLGGVVLGSHGELYGATALGGEWNLGTVYELLPPASSGEAWTEVVLHSFNSGDGGQPTVEPVIGPNGSLYGVTGSGVFQLSPPSGTNTHWPYTVIYQFPQGYGGAGGSLVLRSTPGYGPSLYGTTGCSDDYPSGDAGCGFVYRLTPPVVAGGAWSYATLYTFPGAPVPTLVAGSLAVGAGGTLFGVTANAGYVGGGCHDIAGCGTVFSLTPPIAAGGPWTEETLYAFNGNGNRPEAGVLIGPGGLLFGTTVAGGPGGGSPGQLACGEGEGGGGGTVFSLIPPAAAGAPMTETNLHEFGVSDVDGCQPATPLVLGPNGVLYGTTKVGGASNSGIVFELTPPASTGGSWTETILHSFPFGNYVSIPSGLTVPPDGTLYGTIEGGPSEAGSVFALTP